LDIADIHVVAYALLLAWHQEWEEGVLPEVLFESDQSDLVLWLQSGLIVPELRSQKVASALEQPAQPTRFFEMVIEMVIESIHVCFTF